MGFHWKTWFLEKINILGGGETYLKRGLWQFAENEGGVDMSKKVYFSIFLDIVFHILSWGKFRMLE